MTARHWIAAAALAAGAAVTTSSLTPAAQASSPSSAESQDTSTLDDQVELAVTVYNSDLALVRDVRNSDLRAGTFDLRFMDIAATVNPATVHFRSLTEPGASACSNRTTSTTCSSRTSCCASTSDAT